MNPTDSPPRSTTAARLRIAAAILLGAVLPIGGIAFHWQGIARDFGMDAGDLLHPGDVARRSPLLRLVERYESATKELPLDEPIGFLRTGASVVPAEEPLYLTVARLALAPRRVVEGALPARVLLDADTNAQLEAAAREHSLEIRVIVAPGLAIAERPPGPSSRR